MKKILYLFSFLFIIISCSSKSDQPSSNNSTNPTSRNVKYEVTGNYTGKVTIVYQNQSGTMITETHITLPWTKEFTAEANVQSVGYNINTTGTSTLGVAGQTVNAKLYIGGEVKKSENITANANGHITIGSIMHYF